MSTVILSGTTLLEYVQQAQNICGTDFPIIGLNRQYHIEPSKTFNSLPHTEVDARHVGYIEQVEKIFEEERKRAGIIVPCIVKTVTRNGSKC